MPSNGLVAWWPFSGNANDESGNGNHGTVNGATLTADRFGNSNKAFSFSGSASCQNITVPNSTSLNTNNLTINCWIYALDSNMTVLEKSDPSDASKLSYAITFKDEFQGWKGLKTSYGVGNCSFSTQNPSFWSLQNTFPNNNWIMITIKIYSNGDIEQYLNSNLVFSASGTQSFISCNDPLSSLRIGGVHWNNDPECFNGYIDDIGIWNRALTTSEILNLYNGCPSVVNLQPINQTETIGTNAQFIVGSSSPSAAYQWQTDLGLGFQNISNAGQYNGATDDTLTVINVSMTNDNQVFRCIIEDGGCLDTTITASLDVINNASITEQNPISFTINPNPTSDHFVLYLKDENLIGNEVFIYNCVGQSILSFKLSNQESLLQIDELPQGIYILQIQNSKESVRFIKQ